MPVSLVRSRANGVEWLATNLYKRDRFFFLGLNNAIPIKELGHCSAYVLESVELTQVKVW